MAVATNRNAPPEPLPIKRLTLEHERLRIVLYGEAGAGKTTLAATFPRPIFVDTDGGLVSLAVEGVFPNKVEPEGYKDWEALYWTLKQRRGEFDTVVIDSLPTAARYLMTEIQDSALAGKEGTVKEVMRWNPEQSHYLAGQNQMARILADMRRLDAHIVLTAGVRTREGRRSPDVSPGMFQVINYWASILGELQVLTHDAKGEELKEPRRILFTGYGARDTKSRFRSLLPYVADPTFKVIWGKVLKQYEAATAKQEKEEQSAQ